MMADLIDRQALYEKAATLEAQALDYVGKLIERDGDDTSTEWKIWSAILTERSAFKHDVADAPTIEPEPRWIPCSDRYPDMDERVLVYTVAHEYHVWDCMSNRADNYFWEDEAGLYHDKYVVDLWMPLPEPYKENT